MPATLVRCIEMVPTRAVAAFASDRSRVGPRCERHRLRSGETLFCAGDKFRMLYFVRRGVLKSFAISADGLVQVMGFPMTGEVVGLTGIGTGSHPNNVVALDDAELFMLPMAQFEQWARQSEAAMALMLRTLAHEIRRSEDLSFVLGAMRAEQRLALFLLDLSQRYQQMGFSRSRFILRMTRQDIGSHLGLQLETVSRAMSRLHGTGCVQVQGKSIALLDFPALWRLGGVSPDNQRAAVEPILDRDGCLRLATSSGFALGSPPQSSRRARPDVAMPE